MLDRYDPRSSDDRNFGERSRGSRGGSSERDHARIPRRAMCSRRISICPAAGSVGQCGTANAFMRSTVPKVECWPPSARFVSCPRAISATGARARGEPSATSNKRVCCARVGSALTTARSSLPNAAGTCSRRIDTIDTNARGSRARPFHAGLRKPRELTHDSKVYRASLARRGAPSRQGGRVDRVGFGLRAEARQAAVPARA